MALHYLVRHGISKVGYADISLRWQCYLPHRWQMQPQKTLALGVVPRRFPWPPWIAPQYKDVACLPLLLYGCVLQAARAVTWRQMVFLLFGNKTPAHLRG